MPAARIWNFGATAPTINIDDVVDQIRTTHRYKNALVAQERICRDHVRVATYELFPLLLAAEEEITACKQRIEELGAEIKQANAQSRRRTTTPEQRREMAELKARKRAAVAIAKEQRWRAYGPPDVKEARKDKDAVRIAQTTQAWYQAVPAARQLRERLNVINAADNEVVKQLRANSGLYWGNYLSAEKAIRATRSGPPPQFKPWKGVGRITVQLQKGLSVEKLLAGQDRRLQVHRVDDKNYLLNIRVGSEGQDPIFARVPFRLHRELPLAANVKWAYLSCYKIGTHKQWRVQLVLTQEDWTKPDRATEGSIGIDVGWRRVPGGLRVAYGVGSDGEEEELLLPEHLINRMAYTQRLQSYCSKHMDRIKPLIASYVRTLPTLPEWLARRVAGRNTDVTTLTPQQAAAYLLQWESSARLAALVIEWRTNRIAGDDVRHPEAAEICSVLQLDHRHYGRPESVYELAEAWRKKDKHLYDWLSFQRKNVLRARDDLYRKFAAKMRRRYRTAVLEKLALPEIKRKPKPVEPTADKALTEYSNIASVSSLRQFVAENMNTVYIDAKNTTRQCNSCGKIARTPAPASLMHCCQNCGAIYDQDANAARNLLACEMTGVETMVAL